MKAPIPLTRREADMLNQLSERVDRIRTFICSQKPRSDAPSDWFTYLAAIKALQGNGNNDLSYLSCLLAKHHLLRLYGQCELDVAMKPQGAPGIDIDVVFPGVGRVVAEVKNVEPYQARDFGAQQKLAFQKDFRKLRETSAAAKYLFVTSSRSYEILQRRYAPELEGVQVVLLDVGEPAA